MPGFLGHKRVRNLPEIQWTPLEMGCGCVIDWGWGGEDSANPFSFIMFLVSAIRFNCQWHGAETGQAGMLPREMIVRYQNGPRGRDFMYARRAGLSNVALGQRLTREINKIMETGDPELIASVPHYARYAREIGSDPADAIRTAKLTDLILNRGEMDTVAGIDHWESMRKPGESRAAMMRRVARERGQDEDRRED